MRLKADENIPSEAVQLLRSAGHDTATALDQALGGQPDHKIATVCKSEDRVLLTLDADFSDIRTYRPADYPGLVVLRLTRQSVPEILHLLRRLLEAFKTSDCAGQLWIVERERIRIRR